ncbi:hypothetical protein HAX54_027892, partial [Datura stramonium]|nr:hypothetical protein [Datura stramonium]
MMSGWANEHQMEFSFLPVNLLEGNWRFESKVKKPDFDECKVDLSSVLDEILYLSSLHHGYNESFSLAGSMFTFGLTFEPGME